MTVGRSAESDAFYSVFYYCNHELVSKKDSSITKKRVPSVVRTRPFSRQKVDTGDGFGRWNDLQEVLKASSCVGVFTMTRLEAVVVPESAAVHKIQQQQ